MKPLNKGIIFLCIILVGASVVLAQDKGKPQTNCPLMGGKINKEIFADFDGKRVYFCCKGCVAPFNKEPAKYIKQLEDKGIELAKTPSGCKVCADGKPCSVCPAKKKSAEDGCADGVCAVAGAKQKGTCPVKGKCPVTDKSEKNVGIINTEALDALINAKADLIILDARSGKWDDGRRIPGAKSLNDKSSADEVKKVIPDKKSLVVTYCSNLKCPASAKLAKHLKKLGYTNILEYPQGIKGWADAGKKITKN